MAGARTKRGRFALALAGIGGAVLVASAFSSWVQPAHVPWPSYTDGVPDLISHPSDVSFRAGALGLGVAALGLVAFTTAAHDPGFGSMIANDMTLVGFHHGLLNYVELAGASLLCASPLAALTSVRNRRA